MEMIYNKNKYISYLIIVFGLLFLPNCIEAQSAVTPEGESTSVGSNFVDKYGRIVAYTALTKQGEELFKCCDPITDSRDGNTYNIVRIGNQCWMAENLKYLPSVVGPATNDIGIAYYYVYGYNGTSIVAAKATSNYNDYGVLYNFMAATGGNFGGSTTNPSGIQGACPSGWHLPSQSEWDQMFNYLNATPQYLCDGTNNNIAKSLASASDWTSDATNCAVGNNQITNNSTQFNALPAGMMYYGSSNFQNINGNAYFWTTNYMTAPWAYNVMLSYNSPNKGMYDPQKANGYSVRCVRDDCPYLTAPVGTGHTSTVTQIQWNWGAVADATGYKYNTTNDYSTATDIGLTTTFTQSVSHGTCGEFTLYVWAYNNCGVSNTGVLIETNSFTDARDSKEYTTVQVGNQCWMKENLNYAAAGSWCYDDNTSNCDTYGRLYNWSTLMNGSASSTSNPSGVQGLCPSGWHVPSEAEWIEMTDYLEANSQYWCGGVSTQIAKSLADNSGWFTTSTNCDVGCNQIFNNESGFTALPCGTRNNVNGSYNGLGCWSHWYSSTESPTLPVTHAKNFSIHWAVPSVRNWGESKDYGFSARCVRD
ncbi:MAG: hypothetical protein C0596_11790 [Marinilabiliales bacterium]|nr:MAG: hypothetical protein C0596_11790 [Marinilabiliales bacterium]